jgi:hypothetical protein
MAIVPWSTASRPHLNEQKSLLSPLTIVFGILSQLKGKRVNEEEE